MDRLLRGTYNANESVNSYEETVSRSGARTSPESDVHSPQASSETNAHCSDEYIDSDSGYLPERARFVDVAVQCVPFGDHIYYNRPLRGAKPRGTGPVTTQGIRSIHTPPFQRYAQLRDVGRRQLAEEQGDRDDAASLNPSESQFRVVSLPITQHDPNNPAHILRLLRRDVRGGATCLWEHDAGECGFSSQIDLVKRHIKRVHYRLRPCVCGYCDRRFFNKYALSLHLNTHTGRKPFICNLCGKSFSTPSGKSHHHAHMHKWRREEGDSPA